MVVAITEVGSEVVAETVAESGLVPPLPFVPAGTVSADAPFDDVLRPPPPG